MSQQQPGVLLTRLVPPRLPPRCLPRTALVARVRAALDRRMVAILAGAGYGKSTLLALTLQSLDRAYVWCTLDARIGDSRSLLTHIAAGLGQVAPGFGSGLDLSGPPESQAASLANEMAETIVDDIVLALDDVHLLTPGAAEGLRLLVDDLP